MSATASAGLLHHAAMTAWVRTLMGSPPDFDRCIALDLPDWMFPRFEQGAYYHLQLIVFDDGLPLLRRFVAAIQQPLASRTWDKAMPFRDNLQLEHMIDGNTGGHCDNVEALTAITAAYFEQQCQQYMAYSSITVRFLSPLRLLRDKEERGLARGEMRYCRDNAHLSGGLWQQRLYTTFNDLLKRRGACPLVAEAGSPLPCEADLFWVDAVYRNVHHDEKPMGGVLGSLRISLLNIGDAAWFRLMVLGQYVGIGQRRVFGYGRYALLQHNDLLQHNEDYLPVFTGRTSLLDIACNEESINAAFKVIDANRRSREDMPEPEETMDDDEPMDTTGLKKVYAMAERLRRGEYQAPPLHGFVHTDNDGDLRPLAVPPFSDRVLQRAVAQAITPCLDGLMDPASYGFRRGRSRQQARDAIQGLYRQGYRWVYESDVRHFFDTVPWPRLFNRLVSLLQDATLVAIIMHWVQMPVAYRSARIQRSRGLPQGSPLSPLLANVMLDDFDSDLRDAGCKLVRFADDFVIVAKSKKAAEQAAILAAKTLADTGLTLKKEKSRVVDFAEGFRFLGYIFVDGLAVSCKAERSVHAGQAPAHSWLAKAPTSPAVATTEDTKAAVVQNTLEIAATDVAIAIAPFLEQQRDLIVCGESSLLFSRAGHLCVEREGATLSSTPWSQLHRVMVFGNHHITTPALKAAMEHGVFVHFAKSSGAYIGVAMPAIVNHALHQRWQDQIAFFANDAHCLAGSKCLVRARIQHMIELLRRRKAAACQQACVTLKQSLRKITMAENRGALNGMEGAATRSYFKALQSLIPSEYNFTARNRRPPRDPANALLSLGYTWLHHYIESLLYADGLLPWVGMYHQQHGNHATLASDLMEPFRHVVEREVIAILSHKQLKQDDFTTEDHACYLNAKARRFYFARLSALLMQQRKVRNTQDKHTLLEQMQRQNQSLIFWIQGKATTLGTFDDR